MNIRLATVQDSSAILQIYAQYINTPITFEFTLPTEQQFAQRVKDTLVHYPYLVCEQEGRIIGYAYAGQHRQREAYQWNAELSIYIDATATSKGVGKKLYTALIKLLEVQGFKTVYGAVTPPNPASEHLHTSLGFRQIGIFYNTGYKCGGWQHVTWFEKQLAPYAGQPAPVVPIHKVPEAKRDAILQADGGVL